MNYHDEIIPIVEQSDKLIKSLFFSISPLYKKDFPAGLDVTIPLFTALHSSSESILILLIHQSIFDADILLRQVMEGTVKYCYLLIGDEESRKQKHHEYKILLSEIDALIDHQKAIETIKILNEFSLNSTKPFDACILSDDEVERLSAKYSSKRKNELKHKWSYQSILRDLATTYEEYEAQLGSLSTYALTSHYCHLDWTGVSSIQEQILTSPDGSNTIFDVGHALRILSNVLSFYLFRITEYMRGNYWSKKETSDLCLKGVQLIRQIDDKGNALISQLNN